MYQICIDLPNFKLTSNSELMLMEIPTTIFIDPYSKPQPENFIVTFFQEGVAIEDVAKIEDKMKALQSTYQDFLSSQVKQVQEVQSLPVQQNISIEQEAPIRNNEITEAETKTNNINNEGSTNQNLSTGNQSRFPYSSKTMANNINGNVNVSPSSICLPNLFTKSTSSISSNNQGSNQSNSFSQPQNQSNYSNYNSSTSNNSFMNNSTYGNQNNSGQSLFGGQSLTSGQSTGGYSKNKKEKTKFS